MKRRSLIVGSAQATLLAACSHPPPRHADAAAVLAPNPNLVAQGIPPIPMSLVQRIAPYNDFRGHRFVEWHPTREEMLVAHRRAGEATEQIHRVAHAMAPPEPLTSGAEPVRRATWEPRDGRYIVFARSRGGDEADQLYRLDLPSRETALLTDPDEAHTVAGWIRPSATLLHTSVPLDRTAAGGTRAVIVTTLWAIDPLLGPSSRRKLAELPGPGWFAGSMSADGRHVAFVRYRSAAESQVWLVDTGSGQARQVLPAPGETLKATHFAADFTPDGRSLYAVSDRAGEFREAMRLDLASGALTRLSRRIPWDVTGIAPSGDGRWLALQVNADGRDELRLFDAASVREHEAPTLPAGSIGPMRFHPTLHRLAFHVDSARSPDEILVLDPATGRTEPWTRAEAPPGVDMSGFAEQTVQRWTSFDGLGLSALLTMPPPRFTGRRPVIVRIHGGPEAQATMGFSGRWNYFVQELGIALLEPNVRGSAGYGKSFLALDNGMKREDAVRDIGTMLNWLSAQPGLDPRRVLVTGGSYGGYMTLAVAVHYSERIAGGLAAVAPSNFVTFLTHTESYRRDLRRAEYGDERDPAMRAFLESISPLNHAQRITKPLFIVQGRNDPRVPYTESEQMVARVRANGLPVWYLRAENEGHGFARKENSDYLFYATVKFVEALLLE